MALMSMSLSITRMSLVSAGETDQFRVDHEADLNLGRISRCKEEGARYTVSIIMP